MRHSDGTTSAAMSGRKKILNDQRENFIAHGTTLET